MKVNLTFSSNHTIKEITDYVNRYVFNHRYDYDRDIDRTEAPECIVKWSLSEESAVLWEE